MATKKLNTRILLKNDDAANWLSSTLELKQGEAALSKREDGTYSLKIGQDGKTYAEALRINPELKTTIVDNVDALPEEGNLMGDIGVVKTEIGADTGKYSMTAYSWNGENWAAMDGNYDASNVYFDADFTFTKAIGTVTIPTTGSQTVDAKGKTIKEFLASLFAAEANPSTTQPSVSFNSVTSGAKEVGTKLSPAWNAKLNAGSYTYGPATGVTASSWEISNTDGGTATASSGTFAEIIVEESTNYKITAKANYADGAMPKTNIGNDYSAGQIKAGSKSTTSSAITGYRAWFCGYKAEGQTIDVNNITSAQIRALGTSKNGSFETSIKATKMQQMFFAAPTGKVKSITIVDSAKIPQNVSMKTVSVEGANGYTAATYDLFYVSNATAASGDNTYAITVSK